MWIFRGSSGLNIIRKSMFVRRSLFGLAVSHRCGYWSEPVSDWLTFRSRELSDWLNGQREWSLTMGYKPILLAACHRGYRKINDFPRSAGPFYSQNPFSKRGPTIDKTTYVKLIFSLSRKQTALHFSGRFGCDIKTLISPPLQLWHFRVVYSAQPLTFPCLSGSVTNLFIHDLNK